MSQIGQLNWVFPDCGFPEDSGLQGYGVLTVTNLNEKAAQLTFDIYFTNRDPIKGLTLTLEGERVASLRLDRPFCNQGYKIPTGQFSVVIHSDIPVVAVLDKATQGSTCQGYSY